MSASLQEVRLLHSRRFCTDPDTSAAEEESSLTSCCVSFLQVSVAELEQTYSGVSEPAEEMIRVSFDSLTGCFFPSDVFEQWM